MRKLRKEILWFLWLLEDLSFLVPEFPESPGGLGYKDFSELRPEYAGSSWRVQLQRLLSERLVVRLLTPEGVRFRLTQLGREQVEQHSFLSLRQPKAEKLSMALLRPTSRQKASFGAVQRILEGEGYSRFITGVYIKPGDLVYSDFLWKTLERHGFLTVFLELHSSNFRPVSLQQLMAEEGEEHTFQRQYLEVSKDIEKLLNEKNEEKISSFRRKAKIGEVVVSGLSVISNWNSFLEGSGITRAEILTRLYQIGILLRKSTRIPDPEEK